MRMRGDSRPRLLGSRLSRFFGHPKLDRFETAVCLVILANAGCHMLEGLDESDGRHWRYIEFGFLGVYGLEVLYRLLFLGTTPVHVPGAPRDVTVPLPVAVANPYSLLDMLLVSMSVAVTIVSETNSNLEDPGALLRVARVLRFSRLSRLFPSESVRRACSAAELERVRRSLGGACSGEPLPVLDWTDPLPNLGITCSCEKSSHKFNNHRGRLKVGKLETCSHFFKDSCTALCSVDIRFLT